MQDGKLTVKQATSLDNESSILIFQYQLSEQAVVLEHADCALWP